MGNIQSFNNFASKITNTFSLPFINNTLEKNNLQKISMKQYSLLKKEGFTKEDILQLKILYSKLSNQEYIKLKNWIRDFKSGSGEKFKFEAILEFNSLKQKYSDIKVDNYIKLKNYFGTFEKILDFITLKHIDRDLTVDKYKQYRKELKTFEEVKQYLEGKKLDRDLTVDKYKHYLKELKTSEDVIKYLTFNRLYPRNNLTVKEYKDILRYNLKQDKVAYFIALKKEPIFEKLSVGYFKELLSDRNLTPKQIEDFLWLKEHDQKNVLTANEIKQLAKKIPDLQPKLGFIALKENFTLFTVDEYKTLLKNKLESSEIRQFLQKKKKDETLTLRHYMDIKQRKNKQNKVFNAKQSSTQKQIQNTNTKYKYKTQIQNTKKQLLQNLNQKNFLQLYQGGYEFTQKEINTYLNPFLKRNSTLINRPTYYRKLGNEFTIDETTGTIVQL